MTRGLPRVELIRDDDGNLCGTTVSGGAYNAGIVFRVDAAGNETVLFAFTGGADGANPAGGVIRDSMGNLYGTTYNGGSSKGLKSSQAGQGRQPYRPGTSLLRLGDRARDP